jgi:uncharacterized repeat protein (TIGR03847 family)
MSPAQQFDLPEAERLVVGTVGPPGERVFYLQARQGRQLLTLKVEKAHIAELSVRLIALLSDVPEVDASDGGDEELETPIEPDFVVGSLALAFDDDGERIVLLAEELVAEGEDGSVARIGASRDQVAALARHGAELVAAGRPTCQLCGYPLDPKGHVCPRSNGHGPPNT